MTAARIGTVVPRHRQRALTDPVTGTSVSGPVARLPAREHLMVTGFPNGAPTRCPAAEPVVPAGFVRPPRWSLMFHPGPSRLHGGQRPARLVAALSWPLEGS